MAVVSSNPSTLVSAGSWTNGGNVYVADNVYATNTGATQNTEYPFEVGGFNFAGIQGFTGSVTVTVEAKTSTASRAQIKVELLDDTTVLATRALANLTAADANYTLAATITLAQLQSANLKVRVTNKRIVSQASTTSVDWVKIDATTTNPKAETLTDTFDSTISTVNWPTGNRFGTVAWDAGGGDGRVAMSERPAAYSGMVSVNQMWDMSNSYVFAKAIRPAVETATTETSLAVYDAGQTNGLWFILYYDSAQTPQQQICMRLKTAGVTDNAFAAYDPAAHAFIRVRKDATNAYWDVSPDGNTWTNLNTRASTIDLSSATIEMSVGQWGSEATQSTGYFDNVNVPGAPVGYPKIETLTDTFDTQVDKATKWNSSNTNTVWDASGRAKIPCIVGYPNLATNIAGTYDLTGSSVFAQITPATGGTRETAMDVMKGGDSSTRFRMLVSGSSLYFRRTISGTETEGTAITYDPVAHAWWRIRESGGTAYWDTSPDSQTWTNRWSYTSGGFPITQMALNILSGYYGTETAADTYVDNVNVAVSAGLPPVDQQDGLGLTDASVTLTVSRALNMQDALGVTDVPARQAKDLSKSVQDSASVYDAIAGASDRAAAAQDVTGLRDSFVTSITTARIDLAALTDTISIEQALTSAPSADQLGLTDSVTTDLVVGGRNLVLDVSDPVWSGQIDEPFTSYPIQEWAEGGTYGAYRSVFNSNGPHGVIDDGTGNRVIRQQPEWQAGFTSADTRASLSVSTASYKDVDVTMRMKTVSQNRPTAPNAWERAWAVVAYVDNDWFYYVICKTNGIEVGKRDPAYPGGQRFLPWYQGTNWPLGAWNKVRIRLTGVPTGTKIEVWVDDVLQTSYWNNTSNDYFIDEERPLNLGAIGFYNEDALVHFDDVSILAPGLADAETSSLTKTVSDTLGLYDLLAGTSDRGAAAQDTTGLRDSITSSVTVARSDVLGLSDTVSTARSIALSPSTDKLGLSDAVTVERSLAVSASDPAPLTDSRDVVLSKTVAETLGLLDAESSESSLARADTQGLIDTSVSLVSLARSDVQGLSDAWAKISTYDRPFSDDQGVSDAIQVAMGGNVGSQDTTGLQDSVSISAAISRADALGLSDAMGVTYFRSYADTQGLSDPRTSGVEKELRDTLGLLDSVTQDLGRVLDAPDRIGVGDTFTVSLTAARTDTAGVTDSLTLTVNRSYSDTLGLIDTRSFTYARTLADTAPLTDRLSLSATVARTDEQGITDSITALVSKQGLGWVKLRTPTDWVLKPAKLREPGGWRTVPVKKWTGENWEAAWAASGPPS